MMSHMCLLDERSGLQAGQGSGVMFCPVPIGIQLSWLADVDVLGDVIR